MKSYDKMLVPIERFEDTEILCPVIAFDEDYPVVVYCSYFFCQEYVQFSKKSYIYTVVPSKQGLIKKVIADDAFSIFITFGNFVPKVDTQGPVFFFLGPKASLSVTV